MPMFERDRCPRRFACGIALAGLLAGAFAFQAALPAWSGEKAPRAAEIAPTRDFSGPEPGEAFPGGEATSTKPVDANAFSHASGNMPFKREFDFKIGNGIFKKLWVSSPSSTTASDGLGPLFNSRACQRCHLKDGRGHPPAANWPHDDAESMLMKLAVPASSADAERDALADYLAAATAPEPTYGNQLQDVAVPGLPAEGHIHIASEDIPVTLNGGRTVTLRKPVYSISDPGYGPMAEDAMMSARVANPMIGLGLLDAIAAEDILAWADPDDSDGDGISGKPNRAMSHAHGERMLGRYGWKAAQPTVLDQVVTAFNTDMGLSTRLVRRPHGDCTQKQTECLAMPTGEGKRHDGLEVSNEMLKLVDFYSRNLAVPARRDVDDPQVLEGKRLFYETGCISCHRPKYRTRADADIPAEQRDQLIWPYTDMLLHDMGERLADGFPEGAATGSEWRTAPLWGIGLTETVSGHTRFLHDGRARNLLEAILWHGGEAEAARQRVIDMTDRERDALIAFLNSL